MADLLRSWRSDPRFMQQVATWRTLPAQPAHFVPLPPALHPDLRAALARRGVEQLYSHQGEAVEAALHGEDVAIATPTASGKTLCFNLPVLHTLLADPQACALYLFPTKALAHDQLAELTRMGAALGSAALSAAITTYDGDTLSAARTTVRRQARLLLTNPDMLHSGILPNHPQWARFLAGLRWVCLDEMHVYRGVFGSHIANVLRRLRRLCRHYGSDPRFLCTSATIANPAQLAAQLVERPVRLVERSGAPRGEKHVLLLNPPLVDAEKGIRRAATLEAAELAARCIGAGLQTIVFGRSRLTTELLLTYVRAALARAATPAATPVATPVATVHGYRGGYLPAERRQIEAGLRSGAVQGVVATHALELGIDLGGLGAAVLCGYPGSIASTWQLIGRAGRTTETAVALLVATAGVLDQYLLQQVDYLFAQSPEHALVNPENLILLVDHVRCAAAELPFRHGEQFGPGTYLEDALTLLAERGEIYRQGGHCFWGGESHPARRMNLRSAGRASVLVEALQSRSTARSAIGEVDQASAQFLVHDGAIYLHDGQSYRVQRLDQGALRAEVVAVDVDYYTEAITETEIELLACHSEHALGPSTAAHGEVAVHAQVIGYRRIQRATHTTLGVYPLQYERTTLESNAYWCQISAETQQALESAGLWFDSVNDYGPNWQAQRVAVRARDGCCCVVCGAGEPPGREHDVHHKIPFRFFGYVPGRNEAYLQANQLDNLLLLCRACHRRMETAGQLQTGLDGLAYLLSQLAPLHLMCDRSDLGVSVARAGQPGSCARIYLYERVPAGLGFSALLCDLHEALLAAACSLVHSCPCAQGCPACVGPVLEGQPVQLATKRLTLALLERLNSRQPSPPFAGQTDR